MKQFDNARKCSDHIRNWMRNRNTAQIFRPVGDLINNPNFKPVEFDTFRKQASTQNPYNPLQKTP